MDVRSSGQFCSGHILGAESLNFSDILLRRLLKGVVKLEAMLTSPELIERVCRRRHATQLVLCDSGSSSTCRQPELLNHAQVFVNCLSERDAKEGLRHRYTVQYVDGRSVARLRYTMLIFWPIILFFYFLPQPLLFLRLLPIIPNYSTLYTIKTIIYCETKISTFCCTEA